MDDGNKIALNGTYDVQSTMVREVWIMGEHAGSVTAAYIGTHYGSVWPFGSFPDKPQLNGG